MNRYYFTFGSDERYPYPNSYMVVEANSMNEACDIFSEKYPNRNGNVLNCASVYGSQEWDNEVAEYYNGKAPAETIRQTDILLE